MQRSVDWHHESDLARRATRGGLATAGGTWLRFALQLGTVVVVARILGPTEYAAAAVVLLVATLAELLRSQGIATAIVQSSSLTSPVASALHWINLTAGVIAGAVMLLLSPTLTTFVGGEDLLAGALLGVVFLAAGAGGVPAALLNRNLDLRAIAIAEIVAMIIGCAVALSFALAGAGAMALVWQAAVYAVVLTLITAVACPWRPGRLAARRDAVGSLRFAGAVAAVHALNGVTRNVDRVIVGSVFGPAAAGLYAQAVQLLTLPLEQINGPLQRIALPLLSRVRDERERFARTFRLIVSIVGYILWPVFVVLGVLAVSIVEVLFGHEWADSAPLFQILVVAGISQALGYVNVWLFVASGNVGKQVVWAVISRPIVLGSFFLGLPWGVHGVAWAFSICSAALVIPGFLVARPGTGLRMRDVFFPLGWPSVLAAASGAAAFGGTLLIADAGWLQLVVAGSAAVTVFLVGFAAIPSARGLVRQLITAIRPSDVPTAAARPEAIGVHTAHLDPTRPSSLSSTKEQS
ncbi:lipopolysaccharide biosynthesis protein [Plantibacter sp. YIM 135347]|uniref:lipopolysaccharide biosynthesis protein n=1 Tax=Plantibacter sp. YIM 135347 TaxID=3423919 RepID=UPI003D34C4F2